MSIQHQINLSTQEVEALEYALYLHLGCTRCNVSVKELQVLLPIIDTLKALMAAARYEMSMETREAMDPKGDT